jgi:drug/metabolite transporter (DMT)-like permease
MVISTPLALALWEPLDTRGWLLMLSLGTVFGIAQLLMIRGFALAPAGLLAPLSYVQVVSAAILSVAIFGESLDVWTLLGIVMIVASGLYVVRERNAGSGRT